MKPHAKRYFVHFGGSMVGYTILLFGSVWLLNNNEFGTIARAALALLPVIPALYGLHAVIVFYRAMDEFQQRILSESMLVASLLVGFGTFAYGFLEGVLELPTIPLIWIFPALIGIQGLTSCVLNWIHR